MDDKIRLAFLIDTIHSASAGTEKQLIEIIRRLDRKRFEVTLICLYRSPWLMNTDLPCPMHVLGYRGLLKTNLPAVVGRLRRLLQAEKTDVLQVMFEDSIIIGLLCRLWRQPYPRRLVVSKRDMGLGAETPWYGGIFRALFPFACRLADGVVVNAERLRAHIGKNWLVPEDRIRVIRNGVALPAANLPMPAGMVGGNGLRIGIVANLKPIKRLDLFLQALSKLRSGPTFPFHAYLLGDGPEKTALLRQAASLGLSDCVHFAGSVGDVTPWLRHLDIGVLCSDREGLSNAILEYMACGLPVVATDAGGNRELIDRQNGCIVPTGDADRLAAALRDLGRDKARRRRLGAVSRQRVGRQFTWDRIMPQWENYYAALVGESRPAPLEAKAAKIGEGR